jgi:hypothetical protein
MKRRALKKITLTKETLRHLDDHAMRNVEGGLTTQPFTCNISCITDATRQCTNCNTDCLTNCAAC